MSVCQSRCVLGLRLNIWYNSVNTHLDGREPIVKVDVLGVQFDAFTQDEFLVEFKHRRESHEGTFVVTANPEIVMYARDHPEYQQLLNTKPNYITADGVGIISAAKLLGHPLPERVTGYDLMWALLADANAHKLRVYFIGAKEAINQQAVAQVRQAFPDLVVAGAHDGYFDLTDQSVQDAVVASKPDMVFAALGFPKQDYFLTALHPRLPEAFLMGVGGSFDVLSGTVKRAPVWMRNLRLEWFYRLLREPTRLGRMLVLPKFLQVVRREAKKQS